MRRPLANWRTYAEELVLRSRTTWPRSTAYFWRILAQCLQSSRYSLAWASSREETQTSNFAPSKLALRTESKASARVIPTWRDFWMIRTGALSVIQANCSGRKNWRGKKFFKARITSDRFGWLWFGSEVM